VVAVAVAGSSLTPAVAVDAVAASLMVVAAADAAASFSLVVCSHGSLVAAVAEAIVVQLVVADAKHLHQSYLAVADAKTLVADAAWANDCSTVDFAHV
jgi:hypothetical protein